MNLAQGMSVQCGYVVRDIEKAMAAWRKRVNIGPFYLIENIVIENALYRGKPIELKMTAALAQSGSVQIELIQQLSSDISAFTEVDSGRDCMLHHLGYLSHSLDEDIQRLVDEGHEIATRGVAFGIVPFAYFDMVDALGHMVEIAPANQSNMEMFDTVRLAAENWDGSDPIRKI